MAEEDYEQLARKAYDQNNYQEAIGWYVKAIASQPEAAKLHVNLAAVYLTIDDHQNCIAECRKTLELNYTEPRVYGLLATSLRKTKQPAECLTILKEAVQKHPTDKKLQAMLKDSLEVDTAHNPDRFLQLTFTKFCEHPKLREYLKDESFLTKLQMLVRNPQLANQLAKSDRRILQAYDVMMLSEEDN